MRNMISHLTNLPLSHSINHDPPPPSLSHTLQLFNQEEKKEEKKKKPMLTLELVRENRWDVSFLTRFQKRVLIDGL